MPRARSRAFILRVVVHLLYATGGYLVEEGSRVVFACFSDPLLTPLRIEQALSVNLLSKALP